MSRVALDSSADAVAEEVHLRLVERDVRIDLMQLVHFFRAQNLDGSKLISEGVTNSLKDCSTDFSEDVMSDVKDVLLDLFKEAKATKATDDAPTSAWVAPVCTCSDPAAMVTDYLCLGSRVTAADKRYLLDIGVTHILNVADDVECFFQKENTFEYCHCKIIDGGDDSSIIPAFATAADFVREARAANKRVLVHCWAGVNRSATVTLAVLMELEGMSLNEAFEDVSRKRSIHPFAGNKRKIAKWEAETRGSCSIPAWLGPVA